MDKQQVRAIFSNRWDFPVFCNKRQQVSIPFGCGQGKAGVVKETELYAENCKFGKNLMKLIAITVGGEETASTQYRLIQYHEFLEENGVQVQYIRRNEINQNTVDMVRRADALLNQKCLFNNALAKKIIAAAKRVIFDFDDALWTRPDKPYSLLTQVRVNTRFKTWLRNSDVVLCANEYLANYARKFTNKVQVLPMALDMTQWRPAAPKLGNENTIRIGWTGSPGNLKYLESLDKVLNELCLRYSNLEVMVYCGEKPNLTCPFVHVPYSAGSESDFVRCLDIGLLPLEDQDYHRGKSPIKAIQYLASGVATVGNIYGATAEILRAEHSASVDGDWLEKISELIDNRQKRIAMTLAGLEHAKNCHNTKNIQKKLLKIITN